MAVLQNQNQKPMEYQQLLTVKIPDFSDESIHSPGKKRIIEYWVEGKHRKSYDANGLMIFANGWTEANKGHVCLVFDCYPLNIRFTGQCIISVIDASDNQKFSETFQLFENKKSREAECLQYISREKLLSDPDEFLTYDTLTLFIDWHFIELNSAFISRLGYPPESELMFTYEREDDGTLHSIRLHLDSPLGKPLAEESSFFRGILSTPMIEKRTKWMSIDGTEFKYFKKISIIFLKNSHLYFKSVKEIFNLYIVADKYDIPSVVDVCIGFLKLLLFYYTVDEYLQIAHSYENDGLKELIINLINVVKGINFDEDVTRERDGIRLRKPINKLSWYYQHPLTFHSEKPFYETFDFYK